MRWEVCRCALTLLHVQFAPLCISGDSGLVTCSTRKRVSSLAEVEIFKVNFGPPNASLTKCALKRLQHGFRTAHVHRELKGRCACFGKYVSGTKLSLLTRVDNPNAKGRMSP